MNNQTLPMQTMQRKFSNRHLHRPRLPCPVCKFERLIDTGEYTHSRTYVVGEKGYLEADYYQKCNHCKADIGIQKIE